MTKQEWIIKNDKPGVYVGAYREGLAKGLEIAEGFAEWVENVYTQDTNGSWKSFDENHDIETHTTAELLEIYLTENEKNNVDKNS